MDHPVFSLKQRQEFLNEKNILTPKFIFTKRIMYKVSKSNELDYIKEGNL